jgi:acyl-coenzyme A thioesterase PaaI-like protein
MTNKGSTTQKFIRLAKHPVRFRMFLFWKLPSAYFSGIRIRDMDEDHCAVTVPYKWFSQNPFRSVYFACLAMAAEMSTGALAMAHLPNGKQRVSMLVTSLHASYFKKATGLTCFTCEQGRQIKEAIQKAIDTGEPQQVTAKSTGKNEHDEVVAEFTIEWSFKSRRTGHSAPVNLG